MGQLVKRRRAYREALVDWKKPYEGNICHEKENNYTAAGFCRYFGKNNIIVSMKIDYPELHHARELSDTFHYPSMGSNENGRASRVRALKNAILMTYPLIRFFVRFGCYVRRRKVHRIYNIKKR